MGVEAGPYTLKVDAAGFYSAEHSFVLRPRQPFSLSIELQPRQTVQEKVEVATDLPDHRPAENRQLLHLHASGHRAPARPAGRHHQRSGQQPDAGRERQPRQFSRRPRHRVLAPRIHQRRLLPRQHPAAVLARRQPADFRNRRPHDRRLPSRIRQSLRRRPRHHHPLGRRAWPGMATSISVALLSRTTTSTPTTAGRPASLATTSSSMALPPAVISTRPNPRSFTISARVHALPRSSTGMPAPRMLQAPADGRRRPISSSPISPTTRRWAATPSAISASRPPSSAGITRSRPNRCLSTSLYERVGSDRVLPTTDPDHTLSVGIARPAHHWHQERYLASTGTGR